VVSHRAGGPRRWQDNTSRLLITFQSEAAVHNLVSELLTREQFRNLLAYLLD